MNNKLLSMVVLAVLVVVGIGVMTFKNGQQNSTNQQMTNQTNKVSYRNFAVEPKTIKVKKGTTVTWTNQDDAKHDVTPDQETDVFKASQLFGKGETYSFTFNVVGTYTYHCAPHPYMKGTIEVIE